MLFYLSMSSIHKFLDCDQCKYCKNDFLLLLLLLSECEYVKVFFYSTFRTIPIDFERLEIADRVYSQ